MGVQYSNGTVELLTELVESDMISGVLHVGDISYAGNALLIKIQTKNHQKIST
jgi:hypothetical protein